MKLVILFVVGVLLSASLALAPRGQAEGAPQIGAGSCSVAGACDSLHSSVIIGENSCNAANACDQAAGVIGDNACNANQACLQSGHLGNASVGDGSCNGSRACQGNGLLGSGTVGLDSCNGTDACFWNGFRRIGVIGDGSCNGSYACERDTFGNSSVGSHSCNGDWAEGASPCYNLGVQTNPAVIGDCENNIVTVPECESADPLEVLIEAIESIDGLGGVGEALIAKAENIAAATNEKAKAGKLKGFVGLVEAQSGKKLTDAQAANLLELVQAI